MYICFMYVLCMCNVYMYWVLIQCMIWTMSTYTDDCDGEDLVHHFFCVWMCPYESVFTMYFFSPYDILLFVVIFLDIEKLLYCIVLDWIGTYLYFIIQHYFINFLKWVSHKIREKRDEILTMENNSIIKCSKKLW